MADHKTKKTAHFLFAFPHRQMAEHALRMLVANGVRESRIMLFANTTPLPSVSVDELDRAIDVGGVAGGGIGALAGAALCAFPAIGSGLGVEPLAATITRAITGATMGGVSGSLLGAGVHEAAAALTGNHPIDGKAVLLIERGGDDVAISKIARSEGATEQTMF